MVQTFDRENFLITCMGKILMNGLRICVIVNYKLVGKFFDKLLPICQIHQKISIKFFSKRCCRSGHEKATDCLHFLEEIPLRKICLPIAICFEDQITM